MIHKDNVVFLSLADINGLLSGQCRVNRHPVSSEYPCGYGEIHGFIIHHQSAYAVKIHPFGTFPEILPVHIEDIDQREAVEGLPYGHCHRVLRQDEIIVTDDHKDELPGKLVKPALIKPVLLRTGNDMGEPGLSHLYLQILHAVYAVHAEPESPGSIPYHIVIIIPDIRVGIFGILEEGTQNKPVPLPDRHTLAVADYPLGNADMHSSPLLLLCFYGQEPSEGSDEALYYGQAESQSPYCPRPSGIRLIKSVKDPFPFLLRHSDTRIGHIDTEIHAV